MSARVYRPHPSSWQRVVNDDREQRRKAADRDILDAFCRAEDGRRRLVGAVKFWVAVAAVGWLLAVFLLIAGTQK